MDTKPDPRYENGEPPEDYEEFVRTTCESCRGKGTIDTTTYNGIGAPRKISIRCGVCKGKGYL